MTKRTIRFSILAAALVVFMAAPSFIRFYTDWLWFGELGYQFVLTTMLRSQGTLFTIVFAGMMVWLAVNLRIAVASLTDARPDRKSTRLNSSHSQISYAVFCLKKKKQKKNNSI